ncbi:MAG TPA: LCP family protein [Ktedonobacteraceae bacterium]|nr:LCP family protein [Ktedonobacteraceae bacterium]
MSQESQDAPTNASSNIPNGPPAQPQGGPPLQIPRRPDGSGLLSNWKANQNQQGQQRQPWQQGQQGQQPNPGANSVAPYGQSFNPQQRPPAQNMPPFQQPPQWQRPNAQHEPPFNPQQQPMLGAGGGPGNNGGKKQSRKKKRRFPIWARVVVGILAVLLILIGSGVYYYETNFAGVISNDTGQVAPRAKNDVNPNQNQNPGGSVLSGGRVNILLLGSDDDYKSRVIYGGILAQTDIIVSIDPATHSVTMFSLPRDTWLNVPGFGMHKLDQAFLLGGGGANGASLTMATIHQDFGVYINHYAWVGLSGFTKVIDTVGGIDINVIHPITDDAYPDDTGKGATDPYAVKRLFIPAGPQHLNGLTALEYVRSRHADLVGDIGRSVRQQQILNQLKYKLDNPGIIGQLPTLANDLNGTVKTDMGLQQVFDLVNFARSVDQSKIQKITLGAPYSSNANIGGQDVIQLNCALVQPLIAQTFGLGTSAKCNLQANGTSSSPIARVTLPLPVVNATTHVSAYDLWQAINNMTNTNLMNIFGNWSDFTGIHSLLDLLFLATFESPAALLF